MARSRHGLQGIYNANAITLGDEEGVALAVDVNGRAIVTGTVIVSPAPATGITFTTQSSGNVANAAATAILTGAVGKTTYISGFSVTGSGATAGTPVSVTVTGLLGGTATFTYTGMTGATLANTPLIITFVPPMPSSTTNTNIVVSCPALGAGNTNNTTVVTGYTL